MRFVVEQEVVERGDGKAAGLVIDPTNQIAYALANILVSGSGSFLETKKIRGIVSASSSQSSHLLLQGASNVCQAEKLD